MVRLKPNAKMATFNVWVKVKHLGEKFEAMIAVMLTAIVVNSKCAVLDRFFYKSNCVICETPENNPDILLLKEKTRNFCYQLRFTSKVSKGDFLEATRNPYLLVPHPSPSSSDSSTGS